MDSKLFKVEPFNMSVNFFSFTMLFQGPHPVRKWKLQYKEQFLILIKLRFPKGSFGVAISEWKSVFLIGIGNTWGYLDNMEQSCWISKGSNCTFTSSSAFLKKIIIILFDVRNVLRYWINQITFKVIGCSVDNYLLMFNHPLRSVLIKSMHTK